MATSTVVGLRPPIHSPRTGDNAFQGCAALDWANGQAILSSGSSQQSLAFDANNDRVIMVSVGGGSGVVGAWISVGANPTASAGAGSMWVSTNSPPVPVYVPAAMLIAVFGIATFGTVSMIPALIGSG